MNAPGAGKGADVTVTPAPFPAPGAPPQQISLGEIPYRLRKAMEKCAGL
ncbi:hypothetical protein DFO50_10624 [Microvirgula sp. AG722]|nr:hypothetical protein DFO50_10624 [Microvirgula sp. AG722]